MAGRSVATLRSYGMDLLRWWRLLHAVDIGWDRATLVEARDFSCWIQLTMKRRLATQLDTGWASVVLGAPNSVTGKAAPSDGYALATVARSETVLRGFYDFHRDAGTGPILNPFPLDPSRRSGPANAHDNPMDGWARDRVGRYRPKVPNKIPRAIPAFVDSVGTPNSVITRLNSPARTCPSRRFAHALTNTDARFRVVAGRYYFDVELFRLLLHAGLSRRSGKCARTVYRDQRQEKKGGALVVRHGFDGWGCCSRHGPVSRSVAAKRAARHPFDGASTDNTAAFTDSPRPCLQVL